LRFETVALLRARRAKVSTHALENPPSGDGPRSRPG
jgi:hypothetical protein